MPSSGNGSPRPSTWVAPDRRAPSSIPSRLRGQRARVLWPSNGRLSVPGTWHRAGPRKRPIRVDPSPTERGPVRSGVRRAQAPTGGRRHGIERPRVDHEERNHHVRPGSPRRVVAEPKIPPRPDNRRRQLAATWIPLPEMSRVSSCRFGYGFSPYPPAGRAAWQLRRSSDRPSRPG